MAQTHSLLVALMAEQAGVHGGQPGGLGAALTAEEKDKLLKHARDFKPNNLRETCNVAPDQDDAHNKMCQQIERLVKRLIASKYFLKDLEKNALDWVDDQFSGRASAQ